MNVDLHAENVALCGEPLNEIMEKYERCKNAAEGKGLGVNFDNK